MTDQELKDLVASNAKGIKELKESIKELRASTKELRASTKELRESQAETYREIKESQAETDRVLREVTRRYGGLSYNVGRVSENFFFQGLKNTQSIHSIHFDNLYRNIHTFNKEYDIVGVNGKELVVISVKHILHENDVEKFAKNDMNQFIKDFPQFESYKVYGGVAGMDIDKEAKAKAFARGFFVLGQTGENMEVLNEEGFCPKSVGRE